MKTFLLIGLGSFGNHIARKLYDMHHQILGIDMDEDKVQRALPYLTDGQIGDATDRSFLCSLGVQNFDACIVTIGENFEASIISVVLLKELGARKIIAKASHGIQERLLLHNGADEVIYPAKQLAAWTAIRCSSDKILDYSQLDENYSIYELAIPESWENQSLLQLNLRSKYSINVLGIRENGRLNMNIAPDTVFHTGSSVLLLGPQDMVQKCFRL